MDSLGAPRSAKVCLNSEEFPGHLLSIGRSYAHSFFLFNREVNKSSSGWIPSGVGVVSRNLLETPTPVEGDIGSLAIGTLSFFKGDLDIPGKFQTKLTSTSGPMYMCVLLKSLNL